MALQFYYGSGSPFAWRVWLALEHKSADYEFHLVTFSAGDHKKADYLAMNPRGRVPALRDGDFTLYESPAIVEYLEDRFPDGPRLFPGNVEGRATVRRLIHEVDSYLSSHQFELARQLFFKPDPATWDLDAIERAKAALIGEFAHYENALNADWLGGSVVGAADFALFPFIKTHERFETKKADLGLTSALGPKLAAWKQRVQALPYCAKTHPPHWKA